MKIKELYKRAKRAQRTIVFPEAGFSDRTLEAVKIIKKKRLAKPILIGDESALAIRDKSLVNFNIINPKTFEGTAELVKVLYQKRKDKGMSKDEAEKLVLDPYYFATLLVEAGYADGMVAGAEAASARVMKPALQIIKAKKKGALVSSCFFMYGKNDFLGDKPLILGDCAVIPNPSADELVQIAKDSVATFNSLGLGEGKVAFLSYSTKGSAESDTVSKVRTASAKFKKENICSDGELQLDAALRPRVAQIKCPDSPIEGDANILIMPNLEAGNITYKAIQYFGGLNAVGPIMQGLKKPVNDLSRGCSVEDIITMTVITSLQCEKEEK